MSREQDPPPKLSYASPRPRLRAPYPAFMDEVGWGSSVLGAVVFAVATPWVLLRHFVYDGTPSLLIAAVVAVVAGVLGAIVGAIVLPLFTLCTYWILWHLAGRP